jgi:hypothetical protein
MTDVPDTPTQRQNADYERRLQAVTAALIGRLQRSSVLNQGPTAAQWTEARLLAATALRAADAAYPSVREPAMSDGRPLPDTTEPDPATGAPFDALVDDSPCEIVSAVDVSSPRDTIAAAMRQFEGADPGTPIDEEYYAEADAVLAALAQDGWRLTR